MHGFNTMHAHKAPLVDTHKFLLYYTRMINIYEIMCVAA
jgi:hypothetical protein